MWWFLQILACLLIAVYNSIYKHYGISLSIWLYTLVLVLPTQFMFAKSFAMAPSFFGVWFLGNVALITFGFLSSVFIFGEVVLLKHYIGLALAMIAGYLLAT